MTAEQQAHYILCRNQGCSHSLAEMLALGQPPMSNTDREFLQGHCNGSQFARDPEAGDIYAAVARAAGVDVKGRVYLSGLAAYPGDPRAWVSGRGDVQRVCEERGWGCQGSVTVRGDRDREDSKPYRVADDLVQDRALHLQEVGAAGNSEEATDMARQQLSPAYPL